MIDLTGKVVLVTGGSRGIGAAAVRAVVQCGGEAVIHFGQRVDAAETLAKEVGETRVHLCQADLLSVPATEDLWCDALAWRGRIDVLVNNAGVYEKAPLELELDDWLAGWERTLRINLVAAAHLCREAVRHFRERGGGTIVNIASRAAFRGDAPDYIHYAASKGGMIALTRTIARAFAADGVLAYAVAPGFVRTEMTEFQIESPAGQKWLPSSKDAVEQGLDRPPEDCARAATELIRVACPELSGGNFGPDTDFDKVLREAKQSAD